MARGATAQNNTFDVKLKVEYIETVRIDASDEDEACDLAAGGVPIPAGMRRLSAVAVLEVRQVKREDD